MALIQHLQLRLLTTCCLLTAAFAGPLSPLLNVTSTETTKKEGSCTLGDVVYLAGDEFPGADPCERCACAAGSVTCARTSCEPRPGCKAVHRPDLCCPTYQCECEQEGRVYGNGEKLVDPQDPCRVCYCQGGEVVCRRIACFVRDDCQPRLVPGRCCPEYDNCPLRGITTMPSIAATLVTATASDGLKVIAQVPVAEKKQEITIKEITPVSEIPVINDVKIKDILPSSVIDIFSSYTSSKSPLIPREATTEKVITDSGLKIKNDPISSVDPIFTTNDVSFSNTTQRSTNSEQFGQSKLSLTTPGLVYKDAVWNESKVESTKQNEGTTKASITEEDELTMVEHNPAFPPLPDDLSDLHNHDDESIPENNAENENAFHPYINHDSTIFTETVFSTTPSKNVDSSSISSTTSTLKNINNSVSNSYTTQTFESIKSTTPQIVYESINMKSVSPTENLKIASTNIVDQTRNTESSVTTEYIIPLNSETTTPSGFAKISPVNEHSESTHIENQSSATENNEKLSTRSLQYVKSEISTENPTNQEISSITPSKQTTLITEATTEKVLVEKSVDTSKNNIETLNSSVKVIEAEKNNPTTEVPTSPTSIKIIPTEAEPITISAHNNNKDLDGIETTEFISSSSETTQNPVEIVKTPDNTEDKAAYIDSSKKRHENVLTDLISLVGDVAAIKDHNDESKKVTHMTENAISESEELIPVNVGYKSKNKNFNHNSITETPIKNKNTGSLNKTKLIEIEDDDSESITDSLFPADKVEPTTRRPIIDVVKDNMQRNTTATKDIEIITKSYVPTINRKPTKVIMKKPNDQTVPETTISGISEPNLTTLKNDGTTLLQVSVTPVTTENALTEKEIKTVSITTESNQNLQ